MEPNKIGGHLTLFMRNLLLFVILFSFNFIAHAEYYMVSAGCGYRGGCYKRTVKHRCQQRSTPVISVYSMVPACPCNGYAPTGECSSSYCDGWFPTPWETYNFETFYTEDVEYYPSPDPDMATADDDAFVYPDMNIDR